MAPSVIKMPPNSESAITIKKLWILKLSGCNEPSVELRAISLSTRTISILTCYESMNTKYNILDIDNDERK